MKCFVTGASGDIGRALCSYLKSRDHRVIAGLRCKSPGPWDEVVQMDLTDKSISSELLNGVSCVFHLAGKAHALSDSLQDEREYFRVNTEGTRKLLESSSRAGVKRFVFFSSVKAIGEGGIEPLDESSCCAPETPYGISKLEAERLVLSREYVQEPVVLRLSMVYGSMKKGNLPRMIEAINKGYFPPFPKIANNRSMVHALDVVKSALLAAQLPKAIGQTYIVTDGERYSTRQLYEWINKALGKPVPKQAVPLGVLKIAAKIGDGIGYISGRRFKFDSAALDKLTGSSVFSSKKIQKELGFYPDYSLQTELSDMVAYLKSK